MPAGTKYIVKYTDGFGVIWQHQIQVEGYSGAATYLTGSGTPTGYDMPASDQVKHETIKGSTYIIRFYNLTFEQYTQDFLNAGNKDILLVVLKGSDVFWTGYYVPDIMSEPYLSGPNVVEIEFNDGLGLLKNEEYKNSGQVYFGKKTVLQVIWECLNKTGRQLDLYESCIYYEQNMLSTDADSPLSQTYLDAENFIEDDEKITCYDVLKRVLKIQLSRIFQRNGAWWIVPVENFKSSFVTRIWVHGASEYEYSTFETINNFTILSNATAVTKNVFLNHSQIRKIDKAWKQVSVKQDYGKDDNIIFNGNFDYYNGNDLPGFNRPSEATWAYIPELDRLYWPTATLVKAADSISFSPEQVSQLIIPAGTTLKFEINYSWNGAINPVELRWVLDLNHSGGLYRLLNDGTWATGGVNTESISSSNKSGSGSISIIAETTPVKGNISFFMYGPKSISIFPFYFDSIKLSVEFHESIKTEQRIVKTINENNIVIPDDFEMDLGDIYYSGLLAPNLAFRKGLYRYSGGEYILTQSWFKKGTTDYYTLIDLIANEIALLYNKNRWRLTGILYGHLSLGSRIIDPLDGRIYLINEIVNFDAKRSTFEVILLEIDQDESVLEEYMEWTETDDKVEWTEETDQYVEPT